MLALPARIFLVSEMAMDKPRQPLLMVLPPYIYSWSTGDTTATIQNLESGTYSVTIQDSNFCPSTAMVLIGEPDVLVGSIEMISDVSCYNDTTGSATLAVTGGVAPYEYSWPDGRRRGRYRQVYLLEVIQLPFKMLMVVVD